MKKKVLIIAAALAVGIINMTAYAGQWRLDPTYNTWRYYTDSGQPLRLGWYMIDGSWYHFDNAGAMSIGWINDHGKWYYCSPDGRMAADRWIDGAYYVGYDGAMLTDTTTPDGYKVGADGRWIQAQEGLTEEQAVVLAWNHEESRAVNSTEELEGRGVIYSCMDRGAEYYIKFYSRELRASGGSGTITWVYVTKDSGRVHR